MQQWRNRFWERPNSIKEELKLRENTRKKIIEIERLETKIKEMKELEIEIIDDKSLKLLGDLSIEKRIRNRNNKENRNKTRETRNAKNNSWCKYRISHFKKIFISLSKA